jgi:hypothetical protein
MVNVKAVAQAIAAQATQHAVCVWYKLLTAAANRDSNATVWPVSKDHKRVITTALYLVSQAVCS